jgi:hypothetical protein
MSMSVTSLAARAAIDHAREEDGVHLRGVVAPGDEHVAVIEVVVAARRLVHAVDGEEAGDRRGHAEARVGVDVVVGEARLHELLAA